MKISTTLWYLANVSCNLDKALSLTSDKGIYSYCGLDIQQHFYFDKADKASPENIEKWTNQVKAVF